MTVCPNQTSMGYQYPGGFAEFMVVPALVLEVDGLNRIPEGLSFAEASVAEPLASSSTSRPIPRRSAVTASAIGRSRSDGLSISQ